MTRECALTWLKPNKFSESQHVCLTLTSLRVATRSLKANWVCSSAVNGEFSRFSNNDSSQNSPFTRADENTASVEASDQPATPNGSSDMFAPPTISAAVLPRRERGVTQQTERASERPSARLLPTQAAAGSTIRPPQASLLFMRH